MVNVIVAVVTVFFQQALVQKNNYLQSYLNSLIKRAPYNLQTVMSEQYLPVSTALTRSSMTFDAAAILPYRY